MLLVDKNIILGAYPNTHFGNYDTDRYQHASKDDRQAPAMQARAPDFQNDCTPPMTVRRKSILHHEHADERDQSGEH